LGCVFGCGGGGNENQGNQHAGTGKELGKGKGGHTERVIQNFTQKRRNNPNVTAERRKSNAGRSRYNLHSNKTWGVWALNRKSYSQVNCSHSYLTRKGEREGRERKNNTVEGKRFQGGLTLPKTDVRRQAGKTGMVNDRVKVRV